jgi:LacI family transcriptional regulator
MSGKKITLRDISEVVKVSRMTVSMALRNDPRVAVSTREKVRKVAKDLGFKPNPKLGQLMSEMAKSRKSDVKVGELAFITSFDTEFAWKESYHLNGCYEGAKRQADDLGYTLTPFWSLSKRFGEGRLSEILWARGVDGVIIAPLGPKIFVSQETSLNFDWSRFCNVQIGATLTHPTLHLVRHNHFFGMMLCLEKLESLGYKKIGMALSKVGDLRSHHLWCSAYLHWRSVRNMRETLPYFLFDNEIEKHKLAHWIDAYDIEAVIAMDTLPLETIRDLKIKVPKEIGFATLDRNNTDSSVSGIDQQAQAIGAAAVDNLTQSIRKGATGIPEIPRQILIGGEWIAGGTTRKTSRRKNDSPKLMEERIRHEL